MKKGFIARIVGIGLFHLILYGVIVPFVVYPAFGDDGFIFAAIIALLVSVGVFAGMGVAGKSKEKENGKT